MAKKKGANSVKKGKKVHRKSVRVKAHKFYEVSGSTVTRKGKDCPKCGTGVKMGGHKTKDGQTRYACGKCGTTVWE
jgi:small subunit ribosomal protein S27Ae